MDKTKVLIKNIPKFTQQVRDAFKSIPGVQSVKSYGRCRALLRFTDETSSTAALQILHQSDFFGRTLSVEFLGNRKQPNHIVEESIVNSQQVSNFLKNLYATSLPHGFEQPPPPYFKYNYPPINRTILDSISIALLTNTRFYHQVLHLMNRMNLEPPFLPLEKPFVPPGEPSDAQTQTEYRQAETNRHFLVASDESELASDEESVPNVMNKKKRKPPVLNEATIKTKVRKIITQMHENPTKVSSAARKEENLMEIFEGNSRNLSKKIELNVATVKLPEKEDEPSDVDSSPPQKLDDNVTGTPLIGDDLTLNRIPENQLKDLSVFKNYKRGDTSNKLYIKNLSKDITEKDLERIYSRFVTNASDISVKLMLFGKMKGQAFITFNNVNENFQPVEKALDATNGYIYKNKPMVVCFAKKL